MSNFNNLYMRPNFSNFGTVPASGTMSASPDIWVSGDTPLVDYKDFLSSELNYRLESQANLVANKDNFIYVRGKNGANENKHALVSLFYADGAVIQWPSMWVGNQIESDLGERAVKLGDLQKGGIGVTERPFVWKKVLPYTGSCHYCLIAQFNDENNSNPIPDIQSSIDLSKLVTNNLRWGWRNVGIPVKSDVVWSYNTWLQVPADIQDESRTYLLFLCPQNIPAGCKVSFICSVPDSQGKVIEMKETEITGDGQIMGCRCVLEPSFTGLVSVYLHNPKSLPLPTEHKLSFEADYYANISELQKHNAMSLYNEQYNTRILNHLRLNNNPKGGAILRLGDYSATFKE